MTKYLDEQSGKMCDVLIKFPMRTHQSIGIETELNYIFVICDAKETTISVIKDVEGVVEATKHPKNVFHVCIDDRYDRHVVAENIETMLT